MFKFIENQMKKILVYERLTLLSKGTGDIPGRSLGKKKQPSWKAEATYLELRLPDYINRFLIHCILLNYGRGDAFPSSRARTSCSFTLSKVPLGNPAGFSIRKPV
jgi:hypothetical protein